MTQETNKKDPPALFWNPGVPDQLLVPFFQQVPKNDESGDQEQTQTGDVIVVAEGLYTTAIGCNSYELVALTKILDAHQDYYEEYDSRGLYEPLKALSQRYRGAIRDCLSGWHESLKQLSASEANAADEDQKSDAQNFELLETAYNLMHLSDVFFPLLTQHSTWTYPINPFDIKGICTADLVRYLRYFYLSSPTEGMDPSLVTEMLESIYPEQFGDGTYFWNHVRKLVLHGCLDEAWRVVSKHSSYAQAMQEGNVPQDPYVASSLKEIILEFEILRDILLRAPLPGGRSNQFDDATTNTAMFEDLEDTDYIIDDMFGVNPSDYRFWEFDLNGGARDGEGFNDSIAMRRYQAWQGFVREQRISFPLTRRVPQIDSILAILSGDFSKVKFSSWAEEFCSDLLYVKPDIRPRSFSDRAKRIISKYDNMASNPLVRFMLSIMEGEVERAIDAIWIMGGASGAALPSTMTALLYSLFMEAGIIPEEGMERKAEFVCNSAASMLSSIEPSIGASLAIRLLLPFALHEGTLSIVATISNILEHHFPLTDADASNLISICHPLVERKCAEVLDGCASLILARYRYSKSVERYGDAIHWLRKGVALEALVLSVVELGSCYRTLVSDCWRASRELLLFLLETIDANPNANVVAQSMLKGFPDNPDQSTSIPAVQVLFALSNCCQGSSTSKVLGDNFISCLQDVPVDDTVSSVRLPLAPVSFHWRLLQVAQKIIRMDETSEEESPTVCAFDSNGVSLLMNRLLHVSVLQRMKGNEHYPQSEVSAMQRTFAKALARAFIAENAKMCSNTERRHDSDKILTMDLKGCPNRQQKLVVDQMLGF